MSAEQPQDGLPADPAAEIKKALEEQAINDAPDHVKADIANSEAHDTHEGLEEP